MTESERLRLLAAYDAQCRDEAEVLSANRYDRSGPLWRGKYGDRGFVTYRSLDGLTGQVLDDLIAETVAFFAADPEIQSFEWKTRGHDRPTDLPERLVRHGFQADDVETVMVGDAELLAQDITLPDGVTVRRIDNVPDPYAEIVKAAEAQGRAFGYSFGAEDFMRRIEKKPAWWKSGWRKPRTRSFAQAVWKSCRTVNLPGCGAAARFQSGEAKAFTAP